MSSNLLTSDHLSNPHATPLGVALRRRWRLLFATLVAVTSVAFAVDSLLGIDSIWVIGAAGRSWTSTGPVESPVTEYLLRLERASLVGLCAVTLLTPVVAARGRDDVHLRDGATASLVALLAGVGGNVLGHLVGVDILLGLLAAEVVAPVGTGGPFWMAELVVWLPLTVGLAVCLPAAVVAAVRSGLVVRRPTTRQRWLAALGVLTFVAIYSPSDSVTFVFGSILGLAGLVVGLALVE